MTFFETASLLMERQNFDCLAVAGVDFSSERFESYELNKGRFAGRKGLFFDLASLTKPLTLSSSFLLRPDLFDGEEDFSLLLNHRGGLPEGGRCSRKSWREDILSFPIIPSPTCYSDFSALRLMLELEKKSGLKLFDLCGKFFDKELLFWKDVKEKSLCVSTGTRGGQDIQGEVHDDNAFIIGEFCSHAGLFATVDGLCRSLLNLAGYGLLESMEKAFRIHDGERFICGQDRPMDGETSLAGKGISSLAFGHLGFTGTSFWIDLEKKKGLIILSNAVSASWYDRDSLNHLRREVGKVFWSEGLSLFKRME